MNTTDTAPLIEQIRSAINCASRENRSNTHDFVLAGFLMDCLEAFEQGVNERDRLKETPPDPTGMAAEARQCYSREGLKAFAAKHFPDMRIDGGEWVIPELEARALERHAEQLRRDSAEIELTDEDAGWLAAKYMRAAELADEQAARIRSEAKENDDE
jgi:hypothetical protein